MESPSSLWKWRAFLPVYGLTLGVGLVVLMLCVLAAAPGSDAIYHLSSTRSDLRLYVTAPDRGLSVQLLPQTDYAPVALQVAPDGANIADITIQGGYTAMHLMRFDGTGRRTLAAQPANAGDMQWSPDSRRLIFTARLPDQDTTDLFTIDIVTGEIVALSQTPASEMMPEWSPDGRQVMYLRSSDTSRVDLFVTELATTAARDLPVTGSSATRNLTADDALESDPHWSPDGTQIAYVSNVNGSNDIFVIDMDSGQRHSITDTPASESWPRWSPDGRYLAFVRQMGGSRSMVLYAIDTGETRDLVRGVQGGGLPVWSPDGTVIAFSGLGEDGTLDIFTIDPETGFIRQITTHDGSNYRPIWAPR